MVQFSVCALLCLVPAADSATLGQATLLEFTADWCGACRAVEPTVQRLIADGYPVRRVQADQERELTAQFRVTGVPCFVLVSGGREVDRVVGVASYDRLRQMFERAGGTGSSQAAAAVSQPATVRGQSPPAAGYGLPRPLAALARGLRDRAPRADDSVDQPSTLAAVSLSQPADAGLSPDFSSSGPSAQFASHPTPADTGMSTTAPLDAASVRQNLQATVRLRVEDATGHSLGTGTIIDTHGDESLVVTCGHIFRDSGGKGPIHVDIFAPRAATVRGTLISCDMERDVAMVAIAPGMPVSVAKVAPPAYRFERGQAVHSIGCDKGADPSVRTSRISAIDRYTGAPNLEVAGTPVEGRSGGGLFSADGFLIGVCNAADPHDQEGIYASLPIIHWELDKIGQRMVYDVDAPTRLAAVPPAAASRRPVDGGAPSAIPAAENLPREMPQASLAVAPAAPLSDGDTEVICIVRSRSNPQGSERLLVLDRPSRDLLDRLAVESQRAAALGLARSPASSPAAQGRFPQHDPDFGRTPVIRAQSK